MHIVYDFAEREAVPFGAVDGLFPVAELDASIVQNRDAQLRLKELDEEAVIVIAPDGMASSYYLGDHELTLISISEFPLPLKHALSQAVDGSIEKYSHVQFGKHIESGANRTLSEFKSATQASSEQ